MYPSAQAFLNSEDATAVDNAQMEDLFREILVDDSTSPTTAVDGGRPVQEAASAAAPGPASTEVENQGQGECLGKRKREDDDESGVMSKKIADSNAFDGMDLQLGAANGLEFGFDWTIPTANTQLSNEEMQQMLNQLDPNVDLMHFSNDLGLDMNIPLDLWSNTGITSTF